MHIRHKILIMYQGFFCQCADFQGRMMQMVLEAFSYIIFFHDVICKLDFDE